jgi:hypothetical protein
MKRVLMSLAVGVVAVVGAEAREGAASFSVAVTPFTEYVWRGMPLTDGPVLQSSYTLAAKGVSFNIWENVDLDNAKGVPGAVTEHDYMLGYDLTAGKATVSLGLLYYTFPDLGDPTTEIVVGASFDVPGKPSITLYRDVDDLEGLYASIGAGHSFALQSIDEQTIDLSLAVGYGTDKHNVQYGATVDKSALTDILVTVSSTFQFDESFGVTPSLVFASVIDPDIVDAFDADGKDTSYVVLGVTLSFGF